MCIARADIMPGAYVAESLSRRLFEVQSLPDNRTVRLIDVASPIDEPLVVGWLIENAVRRLDLVRQAPCLEDTASVEEFGPLG